MKRLIAAVTLAFSTALSIAAITATPKAFAASSIQTTPSQTEQANKLNQRFTKEHEQTLDKLNERFKKSFQENLND
jgi:flagellar motor switch protein FliM